MTRRSPTTPLAKHPRRMLRHQVVEMHDGSPFQDLRNEFGMQAKELSKAMGVAESAWFYFENPEKYIDNRLDRKTAGRSPSPTVGALARLADSQGMDLFIEFRPKVRLGGYEPNDG